jgi:hypothetical protein
MRIFAIERLQKHDMQQDKQTQEKDERSGSVCLQSVIIPRAGQFCALQTDAVRRQIWVTPNKRSAVRGTAYISPQLRKELNSFCPSSPQGIKLLRSSDGAWTVYPELRFACTRLSRLDAYSVKRHEVSLHFYITILTRAQYI